MTLAGTLEATESSILYEQIITGTGSSGIFGCADRLARLTDFYAAKRSDQMIAQTTSIVHGIGTGSINADRVHLRDLTSFRKVTPAMDEKSGKIQYL